MKKLDSITLHIKIKPCSLSYAINKLRDAGYIIDEQEAIVSVHHKEFESKSTPKPYLKYFSILTSQGYGIQSSII